MADGQDKVCESKRKKFFATRKRKRIAIAIAGIIIIIAFITVVNRPVKLKKEGVEKVLVIVNYVGDEEENALAWYDNDCVEDSIWQDLWYPFNKTEAAFDITGRAEITDAADIADVLKLVNSIQTRYPICSTGMIYGPNATVATYDKTGNVLQKIDIFEDVLHNDNDKEYKIGGSQYKKLKDICKKYGMVEYRDR